MSAADSVLKSLPPLPAFSPDTKVYSRPEGVIDPASPYARAMRQYATGSVRDPASMQPAHIIYPATEGDIVAAIRYARNAGIAIAVRSGGHAYHGGSSTGGPNIQLDTSQCAPCKVWTFDEKARQLTLGTGWKLGEVDGNLQNNYQGYPTRGYFFVHGNCAGVGIGGHMHTGGSSMQGRSFGYFVDYITRFRIITADGQIRDVHPPHPAAPDETNDELWFAVLGGSPGSFGVCTELTVRVLHDRDFPASRAYMQTYVWTRSQGTRLVEALLQHLAVLNDRDNLPADFCLHVGTASAAPKYHRWRNILRDVAATAVGLLEQALELRARREPGRLLARLSDALLRIVRGVFGTRGGRNPLFEASFVPIIVVQATWNNLSGKASDYDDGVKSFFAELDAVAEPYLPRGLSGRLLQRAMRIIDPGKHLPVTQIMQAFTFKGDREYDLPYIKRNWAGYEAQLAPRGFARECARLFESFTYSIFSPASETWNGHALICVWGLIGGSARNILDRENAARTSLPNRAARNVWVSDYFYDPAMEGAADRLRAWIARYDKLAVGSEAAFFSTRDARFMFDPFEVAGPDGKTAPLNLHRMRAHFYDDDRVYQRVLAIKHRIDPDGVFSAHAFSAGARESARGDPQRADPVAASDASAPAGKREAA